MMTLRRPAIADLICVVEIDDGRILIKKIQPSKARGLFHLVSRREEPILNVRIDCCEGQEHGAERMVLPVIPRYSSGKEG
jgi:hypothetical protein